MDNSDGKGGDDRRIISVYQCLRRGGCLWFGGGWWQGNQRQRGAAAVADGLSANVGFVTVATERFGMKRMACRLDEVQG